MILSYLVIQTQNSFRLIFPRGYLHTSSSIFTLSMILFPLLGTFRHRIFCILGNNTPSSGHRRQTVYSNRTVYNFERIKSLLFPPGPKHRPRDSVRKLTQWIRWPISGLVAITSCGLPMGIPFSGLRMTFGRPTGCPFDIRLPRAGQSLSVRWTSLCYQECCYSKIRGRGIFFFTDD